MDFNTEVVEYSKSKPVVVDFWAPWCGPCKFLGPVIEQLASESNGKWKLVKVNTDENPQLSQEYRIQGIPAVKMFYDGNVVAEFTGALSKHQIERWLEEHLPDKRRKELNAILEDIGLDDLEDLSRLQTFVNENADFLEARVNLARLMAFSQPIEAGKLIEDIIPGNKIYNQVEDVKMLSQFASVKSYGDDDIGEKVTASRNAIIAGDFDLALDKLIQSVMINKDCCNELPRKTIIALFNLLGKDHMLTKKYRKRFDMALY